MIGCFTSYYRCKQQKRGSSSSQQDVSWGRPSRFWLVYKCQAFLSILPPCPIMTPESLRSRSGTWGAAGRLYYPAVRSSFHHRHQKVDVVRGLKSHHKVVRENAGEGSSLNPQRGLHPQLMESLLRSSLPHCIAPEQLIRATVPLLISLKNLKRVAKIVTRPLQEHTHSVFASCVWRSCSSYSFIPHCGGVNIKKIQRGMNKLLCQCVIFLLIFFGVSMTVKTPSRMNDGLTVFFCNAVKKIYSDSSAAQAELITMSLLGQRVSFLLIASPTFIQRSKEGLLQCSRA